MHLNVRLTSADYEGFHAMLLHTKCNSYQSKVVLIQLVTGKVVFDTTSHRKSSFL